MRILVIALAVYAVLLTLVSAWVTFGGPGGPPLAKTAAEQRILEVVEQAPSMSGPASSTTDGRLLRLLAEAIGAENVVEIGTLNGHSGLWLCNALRTTGGKLTTFEIDPRRASTAREVFKRAGVGEIATVVEGDAHVNVTKLEEPIDLAFIDADKDGYLDYLNKLLPLVRPGGLIVAHNMSFPPPDLEYIAAITTNPALETVFVNMASAGIAVTLKKR